jgi:hypothetical protein
MVYAMHSPHIMFMLFSKKVKVTAPPRSFIFTFSLLINHSLSHVINNPHFVNHHKYMQMNDHIVIFSYLFIEV